MKERKLYPEDILMVNRSKKKKKKKNPKNRYTRKQSIHFSMTPKI